MKQKYFNLYCKIIIRLGIISSLIFVAFMDYQNFALYEFFHDESYLPWKNNHENNFNEEQKFFIHGDLTQPTEILQKKAIHLKYPQDKIFFVHYIDLLMKDIKFLTAKEWDNLQKNKLLLTKFYQKNQFILKELAKAEKIDPNNALYDYYKCYILSREALTEEESYNYKRPTPLKTILSPKKNKVKIYSFNYKKDVNYKLVDEKKLAEAVQAFKKGLTKKYYTFYEAQYREKMAKSLNIKNNNITNNLYIMSYGSGYYCYSSIIATDLRTLSFYAKYLATPTHNNNAKIISLLNSSRPLINQSRYFNDQDIIKILKNLNYAFLCNHVKINYYYSINKQNLAQKYIKKIDEHKAIKNYISNAIQHGGFSDGVNYQHGGMFSIIFSPYKNTVYSEEKFKQLLYPERQMSYKMLEQLYLHATFIPIFILMSILGITIGLKFYRKERALFIKPTTKDLLKIIFLGGVTPVAIYLLLINNEFLSGRDYSMFYNKRLLAYQGGLLSTSLLIGIIITVSLFVRRHCLKNNIKTPKSLSLFLIVNVVNYFCLLLFSTPLLQYLLNEKHMIATKTHYNGFEVSFGIYQIILFIIMLLYIINPRRRFKQYKMFLYQNLLPYLAIIPLILVIAIYFITVKQEEYYFAQDKIIFNKDNYNSYFPSELQMIKKVNAMMDKSID